MTRLPLPVTAAALLVLLMGCRSEERSPLGAARKFVRAVESTDSQAIYGLLAPTTQAKLAELLHLAQAQAGGPRHLKAADLLVAGMYRLPLTASMELGQVKESGDRATVEILHRKKRIHTLQLIRTEQGLWRVLLPDAALEPPDPGAPAKSQPASQPTPASNPANTPRP